MTDVGTTEAARVAEGLLGFRPEPTRASDVTAAVRDRMKRRGLHDVAAYHRLLEDDTARAVEARALADRLTINETYFFREQAHHAILRDRILPSLMQRGVRPLRILSLGCSSGEEPYGIALTLHEFGLTPFDARIVAVDVSAAAIAKAERATFSAWSLRNVEPERRARYFVPARGEGFTLDDSIRGWVRFTVGNVLEPHAPFLAPNSYDVVFCRNMLIYFTPEIVRNVIDAIEAAVRPGGFVFLGHAETGHAGRRFEICEADDSFYFTKRMPSTPSSRPTTEEERRANAEAPTVRPPAMRERSPEPKLAPAPVPSLASLLNPDAPAAPANPAPVRSIESPAATCLRLMRAERFDEALAVLDATAGAAKDRESEILRAALLANRGDAKPARESCLRLLSEMSSDAEAHYLLGLCEELDRRPEAARDHYERAASLDEGFAMPRLRLGILARRARRLTDARRMLGEALRLFPHQAERMILVFGGGFHADALTRLCRSELDACARRT